jgi:hypothetical protein
LLRYGDSGDCEPELAYCAASVHVNRQMLAFNFSSETRATLARASEIAARMQHGYVGTEHILLALIEQRNELLAEALRRAGSTDLAALGGLVARTVTSGTSPVNEPSRPYTSRAKKTLELAMAEAANRGDADVADDHLLLGLIHEEGGIAAQMLLSTGVTLELVRGLLPKPANPPLTTDFVNDSTRVTRVSPSLYVPLSGAIFGLVALGQLTRVVMRWPVMIDGVAVSRLASVIAFLIAGGFAAWAFRVRRR